MALSHTSKKSQEKSSQQNRILTEKQKALRLERS
jgi:hypothetical protein